MSLAIFAFSKDRAMQCDAMIRSFELHAKDDRQIVFIEKTGILFP